MGGQLGGIAQELGAAGGVGMGVAEREARQVGAAG